MKHAIAFFLSLTATLVFVNTNVSISKEDILPVIHNGTIAKPGQFPYQVGMRMIMGKEQSLCGGSLIGHNWVLTAAHCTVGASEITVFLGSTQLWEGKVSHIIAPSCVNVHPEYNARNHTLNDISLISIPTVTYSSEIQAIKLPAIALSYPTYVGSYAITSGWGLTTETSLISEDLRYGRVPIIDNSVCISRWGSHRINNKSICVPARKDPLACRGDSGGPLALVTTGELIGVASCGSGGIVCKSGDSNVYMRVTSYLEWIKNNTGIFYT